MKPKFRYYLSLISILLIALLSISNIQEVQVSLLVTQVQLPLILVILFSFILGALVTLLYSRPSKKVTKEKKKNNEELQELEPQK
ncbi:lipopolysaccharide assembly protein LapA domain-containing protein [Streptococcus sp. 10F2]